MVGLKKFVAGLVIAAVAAMGSTGFAAPIVTILSDTGTLTTTLHSPFALSTNSVPTPYGSGSMTITPVASGWALTFAPTSGFGTGANNLAGGKTQTMAGLLAFDIEFDSAINLTANVFEGGIYNYSGNGRVGVNAPDIASGIIISQLDGGPAEQKGNNWLNTATVNFNTPTSGTWDLFDQVTGFSKAYKKYHVVVDNDLISETLAGAPAFAAIAKKNFTIIFTTDGSSGGGPNIPEPASLGILALGGAALLARRRR